jgi:PAS domain S-box-containing protein
MPTYPGIERPRLSVVEAKLRESEERYRRLTEAAVEGILIHDNHVALDANPQFARMFGYELPEILGRNVLDFLAAPESRPIIVERIRAGSEERYEVIGTRKDRSRIVLEITAREAHYQGRRVRVASVHDITEQKRALEALRSRKAQLAEAQQLAHLGSWEWDVRTNAVTWSDELYRVYGLAPQEFGATYEAYLARVHPDDRERIRDLVEHANRNPGPFDFEERIVRPDGSVRVLQSRGKSIADRTGHTIRLVGTCQDITERKEAEATARRLIEAEAATRARDEVLAVVAHDLRNPLHTISMAATMLSELASDRWEQVRTSAEIIRRGAARMSRLVQDLLDLKRAEAGVLRVQPRAVVVADLVSDAVDLLRPIAAASSLDLTADIAEGLPPVLADRDRIEQVLSNLIGNAIKFTPRRGGITVRVDRDGEVVRLAVSDTGPGISADQLPHIFRRFWQGDRVDRRGIGLGLPIAKAIVEAHGGRIWAESEPGWGSTFYVTLPVAPLSGT